MLGLKITAIGILLLLAGCASEPTASQPEPSEPQHVEVRDPSVTDGSLKTDKSAYTPSCQSEGYNKICTFTLELTYTNQTGKPIYFDHCYPEDITPIYGVRALTQEESAYGPIWACVGLERRTVKVEAGEERTDQLELVGPNSWDGVTGKPFGLLEGRLQIIYQAYTCSSELEFCALPQDAATSNAFTVTLPD